MKYLVSLKKVITHYFAFANKIAIGSALRQIVYFKARYLFHKSLKYSTECSTYHKGAVPIDN